MRNVSLNALSGDLTVNDPVTWASNATLSLNAKNNININAPITATGTNAGFAMNYGGYNGTTVTTPATGTDYNILTPASFSGTVLNSAGIPVAQTDTSGGVYGSITLSGSSASLKINGNSYTLIQSMSQLDALDGYNAATGTGTAANVNGYYALAQNLIASGTYQDALVKQFNGVFTGLGHKIDGLTIDTGSSSGYGYGLFGLVGLPDGSGVVRDIGLTNANLNARSNKLRRSAHRRYVWRRQECLRHRKCNRIPVYRRPDRRHRSA